MIKLRILTVMLVLFGWVYSPGLCETDVPETDAIKRSENCENAIPMEVIRTIKLPKGYHEGLLLQDGNIWVSNGEGGPVWVIDLSTEDIISEIISSAAFTESVVPAPGGKFWVSDWDTKKLHLVTVEDGIMISDSEISFEPSHPAGAVWTGEYLYLITWTRGIGTQYHLVKMDPSGRVISKTRIKNIPEPSQLAWDGKDLWISSWFDRRVYRIDSETLEITGYFRSKIENTTGIAWDGDSFWVTGTRSDLHQLRISPATD